MWRFLFAGLGTLGGLVLLFFASFSDPVATVRDLRSADPVAPSPVSRTETAPRAIAAQQSMAALSVDTRAAGMNDPIASTEPSAPIVVPPVHRGPVDRDGDGGAAKTLVARIQGEVPQAHLRHAPSAATAQRGRAIDTYVSRSQHQGIWLFPPDPVGGGSR